MANLAIIPARGGSKRIPRKNIKDFLGKPIIAYSIETALKSNLFDEVMVSTDDEEIAEISRHYGAKTPFLRSKKNSDDHATTLDVIKEVLNFYENKEVVFDTVCCIYPCTPLLENEKLREAYDILEKNDIDSVLPVSCYSHPIQRALRVNNHKLSYANQDFSLTRTQDLETMYFDVGQFYFFKPIKILEKNKIITDNSRAIIIQENDVQDIDNESDWLLAELKYNLKKNS